MVTVCEPELPGIGVGRQGNAAIIRTPNFPSVIKNNKNLFLIHAACLLSDATDSAPHSPHSGIELMETP